MGGFPNLGNQVAGSDDRSKSILGISAKIMDVHDRMCSRGELYRLAIRLIMSIS